MSIDELNAFLRRRDARARRERMRRSREHAALIAYAIIGASVSFSVVTIIELVMS